jgi:hypothetical protein
MLDADAVPRTGVASTRTVQHFKPSNILHLTTLQAVTTWCDLTHRLGVVGVGVYCRLQS